MLNFKIELSFTLWISKWLTTIMEWGGGCPCHAVGERLGSGSVKCWKKGRRLPDAYDYAIGQLRGGVTTAEQQWTPNMGAPLFAASLVSNALIFGRAENLEGALEHNSGVDLPLG